MWWVHDDSMREAPCLFFGQGAFWLYGLFPYGDFPCLVEAVVDGGEDEGEGDDRGGSENNGGGIECCEEVFDCLDHCVSLLPWGLFP